MTQNYNPEVFKLEREDVLFFTQEILNYWSRTTENIIQNHELIGGLETIRTGIELIPKQTFQTIFNLIIQLIRVLEYQNAIATALKDGDAWAKTMQNVKSELKDLGVEKFFQKYLSKDLQKKVT